MPNTIFLPNMKRSPSATHIPSPDETTVYYFIPDPTKNRTTFLHVEAMLRGYPLGPVCKVMFSEPITIHEWSINVTSTELVQFRQKPWTISTEIKKEVMEGCCGQISLRRPISGQNFEITTGTVNPLNQVTLKITRGMCVYSGLVAGKNLDTTFVVEEIKANSYLLGSRSEVLHKTLFGSMVEATTKQVFVGDSTYKATSVFLHYMCFDEFLDADELTLVEVFKLAHRYMVPILQDEAIFRLSSVVDKHNFLTILSAAIQCGAQPIVSVVFKKILRHGFDCSAEMISQMIV